MLDLSLDELLTTTRAVRKRLDFDRKVEPELIAECLQIAAQAPMASNSQEIRFVVVMDEGQRKELAKIYSKGFADYHHVPGSVFDFADKASGDAKAGFERVATSAQYLADNLEKVPVLVIPVLPGRYDVLPPSLSSVLRGTKYGSVFPAVWNFQLAARARGLGSALTTVHLLYEKEAADVLGIPFYSFTQCGLLPVAYSRGTDFKPGPRMPLGEFAFLDDWGEPFPEQ